MTCPMAKRSMRISPFIRSYKRSGGKKQGGFCRCFQPSKQWYEQSEKDLTVGGFQLTDEGYARFSKLLADKIFGTKEAKAEENRAS
jgi:hypothetical protein